MVTVLRAGSALVGLIAMLQITPAASQTGEATQLSAIAQAASQRGVVTCLASIDALAKDLATKHNIGVYLFNRLESANANLVSISMELTPAPSGGSLYVSASFVPTVEGKCQVMVESVLSWASGCTQVGIAYPGYQVTGKMLENISILAAKGTERLFLMPTLSGCVSIEKSVYY